MYFIVFREEEYAQDREDVEVEQEKDHDVVERGHGGGDGLKHDVEI